MSIVVLSSIHIMKDSYMRITCTHTTNFKIPLTSATQRPSTSVLLHLGILGAQWILFPTIWVTIFFLSSFIKETHVVYRCLLAFLLLSYNLVCSILDRYSVWMQFYALVTWLLWYFSEKTHTLCQAFDYCTQWFYYTYASNKMSGCVYFICNYVIHRY
jgi:hypothetical protein